MAKELSQLPVSILDLATIIEGENAAGAFRRSKELAQHAEDWGYTRYWFAEHHNMESVASAATSILIGYIAENTSFIKVGAGGIMLPNHAPLIIAEQFGTLESLYPGRIDLGLGRAPGTDQITSMALRRHLQNVDDFPRDVVELYHYFQPLQPDARVKAVPGTGLQVPIWLLGSSTYSAQLAAALGFPFAFAAHFAPAYLHDALHAYRQQFNMESGRTPYAMACVNVIVADTDAEAQHLATSFYQLALGLIRNQRRPMQPPVETMEGLWTDAERAAVQQMGRYSFIGSLSTVKRGLQAFAAETGVDEIMVAAHVYDAQARLHSYRLLADLFQKRDAKKGR